MPGSQSSVINVVTKSGTNEIHGSASAFWRDHRFQGLPATFDRGNPTPPFDREQYSATLGGRIKKDAAWWFGSFEYRNQDGAILAGRRDPATRSILRGLAPAPLNDLLGTIRGDWKASQAAVSAPEARVPFNLLSASSFRPEATSHKTFQMPTQDGMHRQIGLGSAAAAVAGVFVPRIREDNASRIPGYPATPLVFLSLVLVLLVLLAAANPEQSSLGVLVVALGVPVYHVLKMKKALR